MKQRIDPGLLIGRQRGIRRSLNGSAQIHIGSTIHLKVDFRPSENRSEGRLPATRNRYPEIEQTAALLLRHLLVKVEQLQADLPLTSFAHQLRLLFIT